MKTRFIARPTSMAIGLAASLFCSNASATDYIGNGYQVGIIRAPDGRPCTFFSLVGVSVADPVVPNSAWFAIPQAAVGYKEMLALLLSSKLTGKSVYVSTTGAVNASCGQVEVSVIQQP
jgi:hypothetical protein